MVSLKLSGDSIDVLGILKEEETKTMKLQKMKEVLTKQELKVSEAAIDMEEKIPEVVLKPFKG